MTALTLRLLPATHAQEHEPHVVARGGWVMTGVALELCAAALDRPQTLALCDGSAPTATPEDIGRIRQVFEAAAAGPADLGGAAANNWLTLLDAALPSADVVDMNAPAPSRAPGPDLRPLATTLRWQDGGGA